MPGASTTSWLKLVVGRIEAGNAERASCMQGSTVGTVRLQRTSDKQKMGIEEKEKERRGTKI